jgi:hypothetical protein
MLRELDRRFAERFFAWTAYLHSELGGAVEHEERMLIEEGAINRWAACWPCSGRIPRQAVP